MSNNNRTTADVVREKYEDRGWDLEQNSDVNIGKQEKINPLPLSDEEYKVFCLLLSKIALYDKDPKLCETYFELQRRAYYGNRYLPIDEMSEMEQEMWSIGTGEVVEKSEKHMH